MDLPPSIWRGKLVRLRGIEPEDWAALHAIGQDTEVERRDDAIQIPPSAESAKRWAEERSRIRTEEHDNRMLVVERLEDGVAIGTVSMGRSDRRHRTFSYGLGLGRAYWRRGYGREAVLLMLGAYLGEFGYEKVECGVYEFNAPSLAFHRALGFVEEGRRRSTVFAAGQRWDEVLFGMTAEEFRGLHPEFWPSIGE